MFLLKLLIHWSGNHQRHVTLTQRKCTRTSSINLKTMIKYGTKVSITNYNNAKHNVEATGKQNRLYFNIYNIYKLRCRLLKNLSNLRHFCAQSDNIFPFYNYVYNLYIIINNSLLFTYLLISIEKKEHYIPKWRWMYWELSQQKSHMILIYNLLTTKNTCKFLHTVIIDSLIIQIN